MKATPLGCFLFTLALSVFVMLVYAIIHSYTPAGNAAYVKSYEHSWAVMAHNMGPNVVVVNGHYQNYGILYDCTADMLVVVYSDNNSTTVGSYAPQLAAEYCG